MSIDKNIFELLNNGDTIGPDHPHVHQLREEAFATIHLLHELNNSSDPEVIRNILRKIANNQVGKNATIFPPFYINSGKNLYIGDNVFINFNCTFLALGGIVIGDNVLIGPGVKLISEGHPLSIDDRQSLVPGKIQIERNAWIGAGATILPGITIGENAVVAAGAVVTKDVLKNSVVAGIPAKQIRSVN